MRSRISGDWENNKRNREYESSYKTSKKRIKKVEKQTKKMLISGQSTYQIVGHLNMSTLYIEDVKANLLKQRDPLKNKC